MVVVGHEGFDLLFQIARQVVVLQQDAVLQRLVPTPSPCDVEGERDDARRHSEALQVLVGRVLDEVETLALPRSRMRLARQRNVWRVRANLWREPTSPTRGRRLQRSGDGSAASFGALAKLANGKTRYWVSAAVSKPVGSA